MTETARLVIAVDASGATRATSELDRMSRSGRQAESATGGLVRAMRGMIAPLAGLISTTAALNKLVDTARTFQTLRASLETATGSAQNAERAFAALKDFARETPYGLEQSAQAFIKLVNMGLEPSERALRSYGNTASAMGKSLDQMIEAVADAATGEFERLKEFGIRAKNEGDTIAFTFQGVTTRVGNNAREIEQYLMSLGEVQFAGGMERQMQTMEGAIANLGDSWDQLFDTINEAGVADVIEGAVRQATAALEELTAMIASGELQGYIEAVGNKFDGFGRDVAQTLDTVTQLWGRELAAMGFAGSESAKSVGKAFKNLPENLRAAVQLMAVELAVLVDYGRAYGSALGVVIGAEFGALVEKARVYGKAIGEALNPFSDGKTDLDAELARINGIVADMVDAAFAAADATAEASRAARRASIEAILEERDAAIQSSDEQMAAARRLRDFLYLEVNAVNTRFGAPTGDRLAEFRVGGGDGGNGSGKGATDEFAKRLEWVIESLRTEEEAIQEHYERRRKIILEATTLEEEEKTDLLVRLQEDRDARLKELHERAAQDRIQTEQKAEAAIASMKQSTANLGIGLLQTLGRENKAMAIASIAITKGMAMQQTWAHTQTAAMLAFSSQLIPGNPASLPLAEAAYAKTMAMGKVNMGLIALGGLAEASQVGSGGSSAGSPSNPISTTSQSDASALAPTQSDRQNVTHLNIHLDSRRTLLGREEVEDVLNTINDILADGGRIGSVRLS